MIPLCPYLGGPFSHHFGVPTVLALRERVVCTAVVRYMRCVRVTAVGFHLALVSLVDVSLLWECF